MRSVLVFREQQTRHTSKGGHQLGKPLKNLIIAVLLVTGMSGSVRAGSSNSDKARPADRLAEATSKLVVAANQHKKSVETLIPFYENAVAAAREALEKRKELLAKGLISRHELESGEQALKKAEAELDQVRGQLTESDHVIAEARADEETARRSWASPKGYTTRAAIMRYGGVGGWALAEASKVQTFFASKFGHQLPISAYGQTGTHNRLGFDHRNSVDVALHPDSAEGNCVDNLSERQRHTISSLSLGGSRLRHRRTHSYRIPE